MSNDSKKGLLSILQFITALVILVLLSAPAVSFYNDQSFNTMDVIGGFAVKFSSRNIKVTEFSFMNLLPYILIGLCLVGVFLKYAFDKLNNRKFRIVIVVLYVIAGILLFMPNLLMNRVNGSGVIYDLSNYSITGATIARGIIAFVCAGLGIIDIIIPEDQYEEAEPDHEIDDLKKQYADLLNGKSKDKDEE